MKPAPPFLLLDDASEGAGSLLLFERPEAIITAAGAAGMDRALAAIEGELARGRHVAGWLSYEAGYALQPRLKALDWKAGHCPLLWFGVFASPRAVARAALAPAGRAYAGPLRHEWDKAAYLAHFRRAHDYIEAGDIYQANLSFRARFAFAGDPLALYLRLRDRAEARHCAYVDTGDEQILSLSPELFFSLSPRGEIVARPMKGTAARGAAGEADERAKARLAHSGKDRAENLMIVDLMRNDIGRVAEIGSVGVRDLFAVETYPTLHTMVSTVTARLTPDTGPAALVKALFPCGSVTGAPKIRAMEIIRELEQSPRAAYCGAIGHFAPDGAARFNVAIRTLTVAKGQGELGIGGAVVHESDGAAEYAECLLKARYFEVARRPLLLIETLRYSPRDGFVRLGRHLARMAGSAEKLGFRFAKGEAIAALEEEVYAATHDMRVRVTLDEEGTFAVSSAPLDKAPAQWRVRLSEHTMQSADVLLRHKTDWREDYERDLRRAAAEGFDEVLYRNERGELTEGSRSNLFVRLDGQLVTPPVACGLLDGCLRQEMLENGQCREAVLDDDDLARADEICMGNSLRGLIRARLA